MSDLIDRQAFIENERKLYCEDCDRRKGTKNGKPNVICYEIGEAPCRSCWLDDALTDLEDFPTAAPWHRVEEELPNVDEKVLVFAIGKLDGFIGDTVIALTSMSDTNRLNHHKKVDKPYWLDPWQYFLTDYRITHWMPLPEPPKEEA